MAINSVKELFEFLGPPERRAMLRSENGAELNRTSWTCGCVAHQIGDDVAAQWVTCPLHLPASTARSEKTELNSSC
jgi:hypothetical protein